MHLQTARWLSPPQKVKFGTRDETSLQLHLIFGELLYSLHTYIELNTR